MDFKSFAGDLVRHFGYVLVSGCETESHNFCRCFVLNRTPFILDSVDSEYAFFLSEVF